MKRTYVSPAWKFFSWFLIVTTIIPFSAVSINPGVVQAATTVLFQDDFESGLSSWTSSGGPGTANSSLLRRSCPGDFSGCGSNSVNDYANLYANDSITTSIVTTGYTDVTLNYWRRGVNLSGSDRFDVEWRIGNSGSWTNLERAKDSTWTKKSYTLSGSANQSQIQIRLRLEDVESSDHVIFDDVQVTADQLQPAGISIDTLNGGQKPFSYSCPDNPPANPVSITGSGSASTPPGLIEQYKVQIDWGDGHTDNGLGSFTPSSGHGNFSFTYTDGPHQYGASGTYTIKARLYHGAVPGNDGDADAVANISVCITVPYCGDGIKNGNEQCDGTDGVGAHQTCNQDCNLVNQPYCGDGIKNGDEQCDAGPNGSSTCTPNCTTIVPTTPTCDPDHQLVTNGSFETPSLAPDNALWNIFPSSQTSWTTEWTTTTPSVFDFTTRPAIAQLEFQNAPKLGYTAADGSQYAELDSDWFGPSSLVNGEPASVRIYQDLVTIPGQEYKIKFAFSPRPGTNAANNQLAFSWDNVLRDTISADGSSNTNTHWINKEYVFTATASSTRLEFADVGTPSDSLGTFLDNVSVTCATSTVTTTETAVCGNGIKEQGEQCDDGNVVNGDGCSATCQLEHPQCENITGQGWYGQYYNYSRNHPDMNLPMDKWPDNGHGDPLSPSWNTDWYTSQYFRFSRVDSSINFGNNFFPFDMAPEEIDMGHEFHFGVHWSGIATVASAGDYGYTLNSDDDSWVYVDGVLQVDNSGIHAAVTKTGTLHLTGHNVIDIFYAERHTSEAAFSFVWGEGVTMTAYSKDCPHCGNYIKEGNEACDAGPNGSATCTTQCTLACNPDLELVNNGSFELPMVSSTALWDIYPSNETGWNSEWTTTTPSVFEEFSRPNPATLEIQRGVFGWAAAHGLQFAELDGDWGGPNNPLDGEPASSLIWQNISTVPGQTYTIKFAFSPRPGTDLGENQLAFSWDNVLRDTIGGDGSSLANTVWTQKEYTFTASSSTTRLQFADAGLPNDSRGTFIDNVSVRCTPPHEPVCGNGIKEGDEQCDGKDGVPEGYTCNSDCRLQQIDQQTKICGYKWNDSNGDKLLDGEESKLPNWTIQLIQFNSCQPGDEWANEVVNYTPGTRADGTPVDPSRTDATKALGPAQNDDTNNFVSLGFGGSLVLKFDHIIVNQLGDDIQLYETTFGSPSCADYPERVHVYASENGTDWTDIGTGCQDGTYDLGSLPWAQYIKLVDASNKFDFTGTADGFDVDGVKAIHCADSYKIVDSQITNSDGNYCFNDITPGDYRVSEVMQNGWTNTTPSYDDVSVSHNQSIDVNFGNQPSESVSTGSICGFKFNDLNTNGIFDETEQGIAEWKIFASSTDFLTDTYTNSDGYYCFNGLNPGHYQIFEQLVSGWNTTTPATTTVNLAEGEGVTGINFSNIRSQCVPDTTQSCTGGEDNQCSGVQTCNQFGQWGSCVINENSCNSNTNTNTNTNTNNGGGGGGGGVPTHFLIIHNENTGNGETTQVTITWLTNVPATSRVVYDTVSHPLPGTPPNYGYQWSTPLSDTSPKVLFHSVVISGLLPNTTYYFRPLSTASPEVYGVELVYSTTPGTSGTSTSTPPGPSGSTGGTGSGGGTVAGAELTGPSGSTGTTTGKVAGVEYVEKTQTPTPTTTAPTSTNTNSAPKVTETTNTGGSCTQSIWFIVVLNILAIIGLLMKGQKHEQEYYKHAWWVAALLAVVPIIIWYPACWIMYWLIITLIAEIIALVMIFQQSTSK